jgi:2-polyprenyl-6-methoxyphenol hydroxylase-like FAD-dependent oxidoreductase
MASTRDSPLQDAQDWETTDVLVCGGGPTGTLLSAYLARLGVKNTVLERDRDIPPFPRAFAMGEESIRLLQGLGLYEHVFTDIGHCR